MSENPSNVSTPSLWHAPVMFVSPRSVFACVAHAGHYGWALAAILALTTLFGWATVQTGLIDRQVERQTRAAVASLEREQIDLLDRTELSERMEKIRKTGEFNTLIARGGALLATPVGLVVSVMLIAAVLFAVVALKGNKPDYPTLMAICVYSAVVDVLAAGLRLAMMLYYRRLGVETSLGTLLPRDEAYRIARGILSGVDPFHVWFWILVGLGLVVTGQLSRRAAAVTCVLFWLVTAGVRTIPSFVGS
ncbi:MAG: hypothetical protein GY842_14785 [bacterium]|nr:hypothetical protein [bacterium]